MLLMSGISICDEALYPISDLQNDTRNMDSKSIVVVMLIISFSPAKFLSKPSVSSFLFS